MDWVLEGTDGTNIVRVALVTKTLNATAKVLRKRSISGVLTRTPIGVGVLYSNGSLI